MAAPALVVEDGTVVTGANSWVDMAFMDQYCSDMGYTTWGTIESPDSRRISAVIRGCRYVVRRYSEEWPGSKVGGRAQTLPWPRDDAYDVDGELIESTEIPTEVKQAQCEAALREYVNPGSLTPDYISAQRVVREKVGDLEVQYADDFSTGAMVPVISTIDDILTPIFGRKSSTGVSYFKRA